MRDLQRLNGRNLSYTWDAPQRELASDSRQRVICNRQRCVVGMLTFVAALATAVEVTGGNKFELLFAEPVDSKPDELAQTIDDYRYIQVAELVTYKFNQLRNRIDIGPLGDLGSAVPMDSQLAEANSGRKTSPIPSAEHVPPTRTALSTEARLEVEFWRVVVRSDDPALYKSYLRHYPAGTFALLARSKSPHKLKTVRTLEKQKSISALEVKTEETLTRGQCQDESSRCPTSIAVSEPNCISGDATSVCIKRNYRALDRSAATMGPQKHRD